jgi:hypothetical protein
MKTPLLILATLALFASSCKKDYTADCSGATKSFATDVSPVMQTSCATSSGCHSTGSHEGPGALVTYAQISANKASVSRSVENGTMPQGSSLTSAQKNAIICWVNSGAPNN